ncbi:MAG: HAMP domain-containing sensor histidine kinase [Cyclobacteriaceae bacterium]
MEHAEKHRLEEELRKVNQKLLSAERVQSDFLSNINNEINNPLTSVLGLLKVATSNPADHEGNADIIKMVYKEVHNLNFQMRNILTAAEIEAGQATPNISRFNVEEMIREVSRSFLTVEDDNTHPIDYTMPVGLLFTTDREKLSIVFSNLLSNALKFNKSGEKVEVKVSCEDGKKLELIVRDFGVGISEEDLNSVFDRFMQLDSGTRKEFGGHGLGLAVVHSLVSMLNGHFNVDSKAGEGTTFTVTIPVLDMGQEASVFFDDEEGILFGLDDEEEETF